MSEENSLAAGARPNRDVFRVSGPELDRIIQALTIRVSPGYEYFGSVQKCDPVQSVKDLFRSCISLGPDTQIPLLKSAQARVSPNSYTTGLQKIASGGLGVLVPSTLSDALLTDHNGRLLRDNNAVAVTNFFQNIHSAANKQDKKIPPEKLMFVYVITDNQSKTDEERTEMSDVVLDWFNHHFQDNERKFSELGTARLIHLNDPSIQKWIESNIPGWEGRTGKGLAMVLGKLYLLAKSIDRVGYFDAEVFSLQKQPDFISSLFYSLLEQSPLSLVKATQVRVQEEKDLGNFAMTFGRVNNLVSVPFMKALADQLCDYVSTAESCSREQLALTLAVRIAADRVPTQLSGEGSIRLFSPKQRKQAEDSGLAIPGITQALDWSVEITDLIESLYYEIALRIPQDVKGMQSWVNSIVADPEKVLRLGVAITVPLHYEHKHSNLESLAKVGAPTGAHGAEQQQVPQGDGMAGQVLRGISRCVAARFERRDFIDIARLRADWKSYADRDFIEVVSSAQPHSDVARTLQRGTLHRNVLQGQLFQFDQDLNEDVLLDIILNPSSTRTESFNFRPFLPGSGGELPQALLDLVRIVESGYDKEKLLPLGAQRLQKPS